MGVSLSGLNSGIDTASIISQLMEIEKAKLNSLTAKQEKKTEKLNSLSELKDLVETYQTTVDNISTVNDLKSYTVKSSDEDIITASASDSAFTGTHSIEIKQLATSERLVCNNEYSYTDDLVGQGKFIYSYNNRECIIDTTDTTTLQGLVDTINNDADNPGVTASLLSYNKTYHLVLTGENTGEDYDISVNASSTHQLSSTEKLKVDGEEAGETSKLKDLDSFTGSITMSGTITITGKNHAGEDVSATLSVSDSTTVDRLLSAISDAFGGEANGATAIIDNGKIVLVDNTSGTSSSTLSLSYSGTGTLTLPGFEVTDDGSTAAGLGTISDNTNWTQTQAAQNSMIRVDGYPSEASGGYLENDSNTIDGVIDGVTLDLNSVTETGKPVTLTITRDTEKLEEKVQKFVNAYNEVMDYIKENASYDTTTKTAGTLLSNFTVSNIRTNLSVALVTQTSGFSKDSDEYTTPAQIGLSIDSEGELSLDSEAFQKALSKDYDSVLQLIGASDMGSSDSNEIQFYDTSENTKGGKYEIEATFNNSVLESARIRLAGTSTWHSATVAGNVILGSSTKDSYGRTLYSEAGLAVTAEHSCTGTETVTAEVSVKQGFAGQLGTILDSIVNGEYGSLTIEEENTQDSIDLLEDQIDKENDRLERVQTRLQEKYARLEKTLALLQAQQGATSSLSS